MMPLNAAICGVAIVLTCPSEVSPTGTNYRPSYALVESADRQVIVKINDVGPLKRGRIIDFNEQTMRYFDSTLQLGLIPSVKVTPLLGDGWPSGPVEGNR